jgi:UDP-hydrolysing UDP-N-acetyl-D-glucosamine 2-epimerase
MARISVFTGSRAEYGLLYWLIKAIDESAEHELQLVVSGTHLSHEYGYTLTEILNDGFSPTEIIPCLLSSDSSESITKSMAILSLGLASYFSREEPDVFVVLGDRFELLAASQSAVIAKIPIVHIHGGELTQGAVDEKIRHSVTKLSSLHFTSTESYRKRVIQMGAAPSNVINSGALGIESIYKYDLLSIKLLQEKLGIDLSDQFFLVVYHPETYKNKEDISDLLRALSEYPKYRKVIIYPNADMMSREIIDAINNYSNENISMVSLLKSVSHLSYLSLISHSKLLIGNSSSGVIEAPSLFTPCVNIGDRQSGRIKALSTIDVKSDFESIVSGIENALSKKPQKKSLLYKNPYDAGFSSELILNRIEEFSKEKKESEPFYDLDFIV